MFRILLFLLTTAMVCDVAAQNQFNTEAEKKSNDYIRVKDTLIRKYRNFTPGKFENLPKVLMKM